MPKLKPSAADKAADIVRRNIKAAGELKNCHTDRQFAERIGMNQRTYNDRKNHPKTWRFEELIMVATAFQVSLVWLMSDHAQELKGE